MVTHKQSKISTDEKTIYGFDVYCKHCGFSGIINPDDMTEEKLENIPDNTDDLYRRMRDIVNKEKSELVSLDEL